MNISSTFLPPTVGVASQLETSQLGKTAAAPESLRAAIAAEQDKLDTAIDTEKQKQDEEVEKQFNAFVGQTLFGQLLKSMRKTVGKPAYFHGGQAEEIFQQQLDQVLGEKLAETSGKKFSEPMFDLFQLDRR